VLMFAVTTPGGRQGGKDPVVPAAPNTLPEAHAAYCARLIATSRPKPEPATNQLRPGTSLNG
jgi:hypothetical protein